MGTFNTKKVIIASPTLIPTMGDRISKYFESEDYEVDALALTNGGYDISVTKGGMFKSVLGMRTALKITLLPQAGNVYFDAGVGIFGQQLIPSLISLFVFWPVLVTQIWGMINQSKLDDNALKIAEEVAQSMTLISNSPIKSGKFCVSCGKQVDEDVNFCPNCGKKL